MKVLLTGGTGYVGSAVLPALLAAGHEVTAVVRSDDGYRSVENQGAAPLRGDLSDRDWLSGELSSFDGALHIASPGDETSGEFDRTVALAAIDAFAGTGKPYLHTSGIYIYGDGDDLDEDSPLNPPSIVSWRLANEKLVLEAEGMRGIVIVVGVAYGRGGGPAAGFVLDAPRDETSGELACIGDGDNRWATIHVDDLAKLYVAALTRGVSGRYNGIGGVNPTTRELAEAAALTVGASGVRAEGAEGTRARFGEAFGEALLLSQTGSPDKARRDLEWEPTAPTMVEELANGSYATELPPGPASAS